MRLVVRIFLSVISIAIAVHCQGGGGGGGGGGSGSHGSGGGSSGNSNYNNNGRNSCTSGGCRIAVIVIGSVIGSIICIVLSIVAICCCRKRYRGKPLSLNSTFVNEAFTQNDKINVSEMNVFRSGYWASRYFQYNTWHGPYRFSLFFDPETLKVSGSGTDDVGTFSINGTYSIETGRLGLAKTYQERTGNPSENLGHTVTIQLEWNSAQNQFEGKWYVQTPRFHGEDKFELKFDQDQELPMYE